MSRPLAPPFPKHCCEMLWRPLPARPLLPPPPLFEKSYTRLNFVRWCEVICWNRLIHWLPQLCWTHLSISSTFSFVIINMSIPIIMHWKCCNHLTRCVLNISLNFLATNVERMWRPFDWDVKSFIGRYLVPVLRPPRPSRSIHFDVVSETNDRIKTRPDHVTRNT